jgi:hypothetical protein
MGAFFVSFLLRGGQSAPMEPLNIVTIVTLGTLIAFLSSVFFPTGEKVIAFTPAEVDFLFPGPFTRKQLLVFLMARNLGGELTGALFLSLVLSRHSGVWLTAYFAVFLAIVSANLLSMIVRLTASAAIDRSDLLRRYGARVLLVVGVAGFAAYRGALGFLPEQISWENVQTVVHVGLAPLTVFGRMAAADSVGAFGVWTAAGVAFNALLALGVLRLDRTNAEALLAASQRAHQRLKTRGFVSLERATTSATFHLPWMWGCGPNAWRQVIALRCRAKRIATTTMFGVAIFASFYIGASKTSGSMADAPIYIFLGPPLLIIMFNIVRMVTFDFRSELEQLAWLKTLPFTPLQMAAGQLVVPVVAATSINALLMLPIAWIEHSPMPLLLLPWLMAVNVVLISVENTSFLLFPHAAAGGPGDTHALGRRIVVLFINSMILAVLGLLAAGAGWGIMLLSSAVWPALLGAWLVFATLALMLVWPVAIAFRGFDPSTDRAE